MKIRTTGLFFGLFMSACLVAGAQTASQAGCIEARHHYEGHPKPNVYVVAVYSKCGETQIVTVKIVDAIYGGDVRSEEFPLDPGESRAVRVSYQGDKYFSYEVSHKPAD